MSSVFTAYYFPPIEYMADFIKEESPMIDGFENMQKQSYRNRCYILSANGKQMLNIPTQKNNASRKIKDIKISYAEDWPKEHFKSFEAAYRRSPYFEFYEHHFAAILESRPTYLFDLNYLIMERLLTILQVDKKLSTTEAYSTDYNKDYRDTYNAKSNAFKNPVYPQVFEEKMEFIPNLSIIDLICNEGPQSKIYLNNLI